MTESERLVPRFDRPPRRQIMLPMPLGAVASGSLTITTAEIPPAPPARPAVVPPWHYDADLYDTCSACGSTDVGGYFVGEKIYLIFICQGCAEDLLRAVVATRAISPRSPDIPLLPETLTLEMAFDRDDPPDVVDVTCDPEPETARHELAMIEEACVRLYAYAADYRTALRGPSGS